jgi:hypothetical protein
VKIPEEISSSAAGLYIPGYTLAKKGMVFAGLVVFVLGFVQLWTPLRLTLFGLRAKAEVIRVVKEKPGLSSRVLMDSVAVHAQLEPRDRSYLFWNEFRFLTEQGKAVEVRANVGSQLKPLYPLIDADGLPTADVVCYDSAKPERAIFPLIIGTWLAPGLLILAGLGAMIIGVFLLYWANKPIELPLLPPSVGTGGEIRKGPN